jgi:D-alanyl-D-alanine carboxypeptidase
MKYSLTFLSGLALLLGISCSARAQAGADSMLIFLQLNKSRSSLFLRVNDTVTAKLNEDRIMPLASTVKIIVAIEFAKQASHNIFDQNARVALSELAKYYIPNTDGNAHPNWISYERSKGHITNDSVKLLDVARGMMIFSSNANAEYLMDILGMDNVQNNLQLLGLKKHTPVYPLVSALFLYQNPKNLNEDKIIKEIGRMSNADYARASLLIHRELKNDSTYKKRFRPQDLTLKMQREWSDRLPASTTKEYVQLCSILNNRKYFDEGTYNTLATILETLMENPGNQGWLLHAGMKGGSTIFVFTKAMYATLKSGARIELAYFFNDLNGAENHRLQGWMNDFELQVLTNEAFRKRLEL